MVNHRQILRTMEGSILLQRKGGIWRGCFEQSSLEEEEFEVVAAAHWLQALEVAVAFHWLQVVQLPTTRGDSSLLFWILQDVTGAMSMRTAPSWPPGSNFVLGFLNTFSHFPLLIEIFLQKHCRSRIGSFIPYQDRFCPLMLGRTLSGCHVLRRRESTQVGKH